jgi:hypothetical protein
MGSTAAMGAITTCIYVVSAIRTYAVSTACGEPAAEQLRAGASQKDSGARGSVAGFYGEGRNPR